CSAFLCLSLRSAALILYFFSFPTRRSSDLDWSIASRFNSGHVETLRVGIEADRSGQFVSPVLNLGRKAFDSTERVLRVVGFRDREFCDGRACCICQRKYDDAAHSCEEGPAAETYSDGKYRSYGQPSEQ